MILMFLVVQLNYTTNSQIFPADCPHQQIFTFRYYWILGVSSIQSDFITTIVFYSYRRRSLVLHSVGPYITLSAMTRILNLVSGSWNRILNLEYKRFSHSLFFYSIQASRYKIPDSSITRTVMHGLPNLTFQHWSGFTRYTSSYELAGSCVFDKQSVEVRLLQPLPYGAADN